MGLKEPTKLTGARVPVKERRIGEIKEKGNGRKEGPKEKRGRWRCWVALSPSAFRPSFLRAPFSYLRSRVEKPSNTVPVPLFRFS